MKELHTDIYEFPLQDFFGEKVRTYAIEQEDAVYCFDIPQDTHDNREAFVTFSKPVRAIMSHGSISNGVETTRNSLRDEGIDFEIWLHEADIDNSWLRIQPDVLLADNDRQISEDLTLIFTPGHSKGSVCLHSKESNIIFSGDSLGGTKRGDIRPFKQKTNELSDDIFFSSLRKLLQYDFKTMHPFHYDPIRDAKTKLSKYISKHG
jgi:glyoxylase-like metal-dependent hydrolase (beta-lactamase superfamily II)